MTAETDYQRLLKAASAAHRQGNTDLALQLAGQCIALSAGAEVGGYIISTEALYRAGRLDELREFLALAPEHAESPHGQLMQARLARRENQPARAESLLSQLVQLPHRTPARRVASFELCLLLDRQQRYREAWEVARVEHARSTRPFPVGQLVAALKNVAESPAEELRRLPRASKPVTGTAAFLSLPRSGTTLLEQMLDCHPDIQGVGELPLLGQAADQIAAEGGGWPIGAARVSRTTLQRLQANYVRTCRDSLTNHPTWTLDKTVFPMAQPLAIAAVLPGIKLLRLHRQPRDNAVSLFLNNFDPSWGWTGSLDSIRQVIEAERRYVPVIVDKLGLDVRPIVFEELVADPAATLRPLLADWGLAWDDACLAPENNRRIVQTLSHEQVRQSVNRQGVDRWRNYEFAFGPEWHAF
jgi:hypothetical protein